MARKQAARLGAVENFCKGFDLDDPDKLNTGVAFLIVCDMLLTGFDAPIEQVMYIDKRLREHTLLQAIARTNRVKRGKQRGYVVDYIGLANHLTEALTLYTATDELQELHDGLKNITTELPVLEERYQRLLQHFEGKGVAGIKAFVNGELPGLQQDAAVVHAAVKALGDERYRADFEVYLKKFLMSLDIILPHASAQPFRVPAKRFGYLLRMAKERYKDDSIQLGDAGEKVRHLINEHLISLGIDPKVPPIELFADDFLGPFQSFLITLGVPLAAWAGILIADILRRKKDYDEDALFDPSGRYGAWDWTAITTFVGTSVIGWGFVVNNFAEDAPWNNWQGYLLFTVGGREGDWAYANLGVFFALVLGFVVTWFARAAKIRAQEA